MTLLMFYKNMIWTLVLVWFQFNCGFSAQILYSYFFVLFYNLIFTSMPPIIIGVFDQDISDRLSVGVPQVYRRGIRRELYGLRIFLLYMLDGIYQSLLIYYISYMIIQDSTISTSGYDVGMIEFGTLAAILAVINANLYAGINTYHWTWLFHTFLWGSPMVFFLCIIVYSWMDGAELWGIVPSLFSLPSFWLAIPLSIVLCLMPRYLVKFLRSWLRPNDVDLLREIQKYNVNAWRFIHADGEATSASEVLKEPDTAEAMAISAQVETGLQVQVGSELRQAGSGPMSAPARVGRPGTASSTAERINAEFDRIIASPIRKGFKHLHTDLRRATSVLFMRTGDSRANTGFAFSQDPGVASHLSKLASPTVGTVRRRQGHYKSMERISVAPATPAIPEASEPSDTMSNDMHVAEGTISPPYWTPTLAERNISSSSLEVRSREYETRSSPLARSVINAGSDSESISMSPDESIPSSSRQV
jgi:hypothetical protein